MCFVASRFCHLVVALLYRIGSDDAAFLLTRADMFRTCHMLLRFAWSARQTRTTCLHAS
jgi:hypothetical protein